MNRVSGLLVSLLLAACAGTPPPVQPVPARWEPEIQAFERADRASPPAPGGVVFTGSSSVRLWDRLAEDFPGVPVINRGFGGSQLGDVVRLADRIILPYRPRTVLVYGGDNDLAEGRTPEQVFRDFQALVRRVHAQLPEARIGFISIKPSPSRWHLAPQVRAANGMVEGFATRDPRLFYVDVFTPMLGPDGTPRADLFLEDQLHMNRRGYEIWKAAVAPHL